MNITIVAWGGSGDIRPYVALAVGLRKAGHAIRFVITPDEEKLVSSYGFPLKTIDCENFEFAELRPGHNPFDIIETQKVVFNPFKGSYLNQLWDVCQDAEAIIFNVYAFAAYDIAEKLGIPCYAACVQPHHATADFPNPYMPIIQPLVGLYNKLSYQFFDQFLWQAVRPSINQWRQETLNLPSLPFWLGISHRMQEQNLPFLYSYSPAVLPKPADWPDTAHVTGYWFLDRPSNWQPPADIVEFLAAGAPPVYIEIRHSEVTKEMILDVLKQTKRRAVVRGMGFNQTDNQDLAHQVFSIESIPHDWLFPQMAAIVHHGGTGTTMSSLRSGVPTLIVPLEGDQFLWAYIVPKLGLGPKPVLQKQISAANIAQAIEIAINDKNIQRNAAAMGAKIRAENGVNSAVEILNYYFQSPSLTEQYN
ncbi:glycosyltransferase [Nostoc sp. FACHB-110]|uniref:glycosyltransferase n=1 Tax=Nostoc sp. FACHB-110 TaxID=2692834 RepID=UPI0016869499|nr:glycosyltransferase [Nostoc sp. FACHB-110]MBD2435879.1 glycosyltransferase family 1 protein [Nostoc sp. FACHB-110]